MSLLNFLFGKRRSPIEKMITDHIEAGNQLMFQSGVSTNVNGSRLEGSIIGVLFLMKYANKYAIREYSIIERIAMLYLFEIGEKVKHTIPMSLDDFFQLRFEQYSNELDSLIESKGRTVPVNSAFNLFNTPLKPKSGEEFDPFIYMSFVKGFTGYLKFTEQVIPMISALARQS